MPRIPPTFHHRCMLQGLGSELLVWEFQPWLPGLRSYLGTYRLDSFPKCTTIFSPKDSWFAMLWIKTHCIGVYTHYLLKTYFHISIDSPPPEAREAAQATQYYYVLGSISPPAGR